MVELVNPYDTSQPVSEKMFFGRDDVLAWVRENLISSRRVFVLHGPRRIGKTSLLRHLIHHLPPGYVSIFLDLRNTRQKDLSGLLWQVAVEMVSMLREAHDLTLAEPALDDMQKDTSYLTDHFLPQVRESLSDRQLVLMADNLDALAHTWGAELAHAFFSYLANVLRDESWMRLIQQPIVNLAP